MTKKMRVPVPGPRSSFLLVPCPNCGKETVVFSHTTTDIQCKECGTLIAEKTGSAAIIRNKNFKKLD